MPKTNADFWEKKFKAGQERKWRIDAELREAGWTVVRIWGHDLENWNPLDVPELLSIFNERKSKKE
jgi:G:T-mismatch repair DNA endonuclease (very short patch repair protein)